MRLTSKLNLGFRQKIHQSGRMAWRAFGTLSSHSNIHVAPFRFKRDRGYKNPFCLEEELNLDIATQDVVTSFTQPKEIFGNDSKVGSVVLAISASGI
jgi:hypothetical protein